MNQDSVMILTGTMIKVTLIIYVINKNHIINNFIILEFMAMTLSALMFYQMKNLSSETYIMFFFLILVITESILGLSILVTMIRTHSNDYLKSSSIVMT